MGAAGSSTKLQTQQETKLNLDNISTVSMALDGQSKPRSRQQMPGSVGQAAANGGNGQVAYSSVSKCPTPSNPSSVRFNKNASSGRAMDLNGNHFYPNSLGKSSATLYTNHNNNAGDDPNNNHPVNQAASKADLRSYKVDLADKSSHRSVTPTSGNELPNKPSTSQLSQYSEPHVDIEMANDKAGRKSCSIALVFLLELASVVGLGVCAYLLRYTETFEPVKRDFDCYDNSFKYPKNPTYRDSIIFESAKPSAVYLVTLFVPIGVILVLEIIRQLILLSLAHTTSSDTVIQKKVGISFPIYIRRIIRIIGGFLFGFLMTSIFADILKLQAGSYKPNFWESCQQSTQNLTNYCHELGASEKVNMTVIETMCVTTDLHQIHGIPRELRMSFPSISATMATYSGIFVILYLCFALPFRALRFARVWAILAITLVVTLLFNAGLALNEHHVRDMVASFFIGLFFSIYIVFIHLNAFANRLSVSNFLGAKRAHDSNGTVEGQTGASSDPFDEVSHSNLFADNGDKEWFWKNFHIPRVHTLRQSARNMWRKSENYFSRPTHLDSAPATPKSNHTARNSNSNAYINPAFNARDNNNDNNILANHLHHETNRFGNGSAMGNGATGAANQRHTPLRTFQAS